MDEKAKEICTRLSMLQSLRNPHENVWRRCFKYTHPLRANGFSGETIDAEQGAAIKSRLTDSTATEAVRVLSSNIMSGMTPANSIWFELDAGDESEDGKRWLKDAADIIWKNIHASNFDAEAFESCIDVIDAGWFALYIDVDRERGGYVFEQWPISGVYAASSKAGGRVDTVYRTYQLTALQAKNEFPGKVSEDIERAAEKTPDAKFDFVHAIYPRQTYVVGAKLAKNLPIASCHVEMKSKSVVREGGYHEFPVVVPRWMLIPGTCYGVGPVFDALPDIGMINELRSMELVAADIAISGMWIAEDDGVLNPRNVKVGPRKIIVANSVDSMKELKTSADFNVAFTSEDRIQAQIRKLLLADQLQAQDGPAMTATEVHVRVQLIRQLLGPIYGRLQAEYLQPLIERCFGLAARAGVLPPAPESLQNREYSIKYISPLARAQRLEEVTAIDTYVAGAAQMAEVDPTVLDNINLDEAMQYKGTALGVPNAVIRSRDEVMALRKAREAAQQEQLQQAQAMQLQQQAGEAAIQKAVGT